MIDDLLGGPVGDRRRQLEAMAHGELDPWREEDGVRPRAGWVEKLLWISALLFLALVPFMCAADVGVPLLPRS